ncbi:alpha/beta family hydrolase [Nocardioides speluncae]|uniref:alpha/beta hydrolase family protein n=1 Tax=Nocardioides speluncae TaxID=2670337 RepID=UPI000D68D7F1|nr:alpha/beta family hydrolase [Nocardioides speluncae]
MSTAKSISTPQGEARLIANRARHPVATLLLGHGASNGADTGDLETLAKKLPPQGITVLRLEQPWLVAGRKVASPPAALDEALIAVADRIRPRTPMVVGGRSAGARSAARCARQLGAAGCLALAFPLHPPGKPEARFATSRPSAGPTAGKSRLDELKSARVPTLVIQGERDPFGAPEEFPGGVDVTVVPSADHSFKVPKRAEISQVDAYAIIVEATLEWIVRDVIGNQPGG